MDLASIDGAQAKWAKAVEIGLKVEELGYDQLWVYDHFHNVPKPANEAVFEAWTVMAAMSQLTTRIRLGQMVGCNSYRHPSLLAKITSNIDVMSGGRLDWGIGAGWYEHEYTGYGFPFPAPKDRIGMLRECVEIVKSMWSQPSTTYNGKYYQLDGAQCDPKPLQQPHPPIWIGGGGEQLTLRVVAKYADCSNFGGTPEQFAHKCEVLKNHCNAVGRDYDEIRKTWGPEIFVRQTQAELPKTPSSMTSRTMDEWKASHLIGTPDQISERIEVYRKLGCGGLTSWMPDYPSTESLELFATNVIPHFR